MVVVSVRSRRCRVIVGICSDINSVPIAAPGISIALDVFAHGEGNPNSTPAWFRTDALKRPPPASGKSLDAPSAVKAVLLEPGTDISIDCSQAGVWSARRSETSN